MDGAVAALRTAAGLSFGRVNASDADDVRRVTARTLASCFLIHHPTPFVLSPFTAPRSLSPPLYCLCASTQAAVALSTLAAALTPDPAHRLPSPDAAAGSVEVQVTVRCPHTAVGSTVAVVGSCRQLGEWDTAAAVRLATDAASFPAWRGVVRLPAATPVWFKYVILQPDGGVVWEARTDRQFLVPSVEETERIWLRTVASAGAGAAPARSASSSESSDTDSDSVARVSALEPLVAMVHVWGSAVGNLDVGRLELHHTPHPEPLPADAAAQLRHAGLLPMLYHFLRHLESFSDMHPWVVVQALRCMRVMASHPQLRVLLEEPASASASASAPAPRAANPSLAELMGKLLPQLLPSAGWFVRRQDPRFCVLLRMLLDTALLMGVRVAVEAAAVEVPDPSAKPEEVAYSE